MQKFLSFRKIVSGNFGWPVVPPVLGGTTAPTAHVAVRKLPGSSGGRYYCPSTGPSTVNCIFSSVFVMSTSGTCPVLPGGGSTGSSDLCA